LVFVYERRKFVFALAQKFLPYSKLGPSFVGAGYGDKFNQKYKNK
jgi:hypothetical protein